MDAPEQTRSPLLRFFDAFLSETSIRWILGAGCATVLGCSIMLVAQYWDQATSALKQVIMLGYTLILFGVGWWAHERRGLPRTGGFLLGTTLCLLPVVTAAMQWIDDVGLGEGGGRWLRMLLFLVTAGIAVGVSAVSFRIFFRGHLPSYLISYWGLGLAGAMGAAIPEIAYPFAVLGSFALLVIGVRSADQWFYWSEESGHRPGVSPAFPGLLLAGQFLVCFCLWFFPGMPTPWVGFVATSLALPILMSMRQRMRLLTLRHGELRKPWPASLSLPLLVAAVCVIFGLGLALTSLDSGVGLSAISPTALMIAVMGALMARRFPSGALVWATLIAAALAYNFAGVFVRESLLGIAQETAQGIGETKLPIAFYGITWLPLLAGMAAGSRWLSRRGEEVFSLRMEQFAVWAGTLLLGLAMTHEKALFPVGLTLAIAFGFGALFLRRSRLIVQTCVGWLLAMMGVCEFFHSVWDVDLPSEVPLAISISAGFVVGIASLAWNRRKDACVRRDASPTPGFAFAVFCGAGSLAGEALYLLLILAAPGFFSAPDLLVHCALIAGSAALTLFAGLIAREQWLVSFAIIGAEVTGAILAFCFGLSLEQVTTYAVPVFAAQWTLASLASTASRTRVRRMMATPLMNFSNLSLTVATPVAIWAWLRVLFDGASDGRPLSAGLSLLTAGGLSWWLCRVGIQRRSQAAAIGLGVVAYSFLIHLAIGPLIDVQPSGAVDLDALLLVLSVMASAALLGIRFLERSRIPQYSRAVWADLCTHTTDVSPYPWWAPIKALSGGLLLVVVTIAILVPTATTLGAGLLGAVALGLRRGRMAFSSVAALNGIGMVALLSWLCDAEFSWPGMLLSHPWQLPLLALMTATAALVWTLIDLRSSEAGAKQRLWATALSSTSLIALLLAFARLHLVPQVGENQAVEALFRALPLGLVALAALAAAQFMRAMHTGRERHVYLAFGIAGSGAFWTQTLGVITIDSSLGIIATAAWAFLLWLIHHRIAEGSGRFKAFRSPLKLIAWCLAFLVPILSWSQRMRFYDQGSLAWGHFGLLLSAMFCFNAWFLERRPWQAVASVALLNLATAMTATDLGWTDPHYFCIPIGFSLIGLSRFLSRHIRDRTRNQLTYIGALLILVSPALQGFGGSWSHMFVLLVGSTLMVLLGIGLRVRALLFAGGAALAADLCAMIIHGSIDNPSLLWVSGIGLGLGVTTLGAIAERNREALLLRLRTFSAALNTWN